MLPYVAPFHNYIRRFMFTFLLVVQAIIAALLVGVILLQKSEGGGLTTGGSPSGLMSARGAADFLTRATSILGGLFILMSIALSVVAATRHSTTIDASLQRKATAPAPLVPGAVPQAPAGNSVAPAGNGAAPATGNSQVPFNQ